MHFFRSNQQRKGKREEDLPETNDGLPDSARPQGLCPRCGKQSSFAAAGSLPITFGTSYSIGRDGSHEPDVLDQVTSLICRNCGHATAVIEEKWIGDHSARKGVGGGGLVTFRGIHWWPLPDSNLSADIPADVASAFGEASRALFAQCPRASAVMARRALEAIAVSKGVTTGTLAQRLKTMVDTNALHPSIADWATEVRLVGNVGAHVDPIDEVSLMDAEQLIAFVRELLKLVYEIPAEIARRRQSASP